MFLKNRRAHRIVPSPPIVTTKSILMLLLTDERNLTSLMFFTASLNSSEFWHSSRHDSSMQRFLIVRIVCFDKMLLITQQNWSECRGGVYLMNFMKYSVLFSSEIFFTMSKLMDSPFPISLTGLRIFLNLGKTKQKRKQSAIHGTSHT